MPLSLRDLFGLTASDVNGVLWDVAGAIPDIRPSQPGIGYAPQRHPNEGFTDWTGKIHVDPSWAKIACLSSTQYRDLFLLLAHEGMHATDNVFQRALTKTFNLGHRAIFNREGWENGGFRDPPQPTWGTPGKTPADISGAYSRYRQRTPACCGS